ncbi:DNA-binding protein RFX2-like [Tubulanus polymorphus]|uniref:DNA-binding protein RFX2-like n=1 Tax=Tubulanus polymorphus TaxID=672921 RepID=UPI003DA365F2
MATQTYVTEMQAINANNIQALGTQSNTPSQSPQTPTKAAPQTATIIQSAQTGQQFIVTTSVAAAEQNNTQENANTTETVTLQAAAGQTVYPAHVQYVESSDPTVYAATNGQMQNYTDYTQAAMYTPVSGTYYQTASGSQVQSIQRQFMAQHGGTYLLQGGTMDGEGFPITHTTRASPATWEYSDQAPGNEDPAQNYHPSSWSNRVDLKAHEKEVQWLIENYETADGVSLPRSTLYNHYLRHCHEQKMDPMNPASFGKLIRSVFLGLRTRRLGTRGNSKYHYYGIRIKANSPLNQFTDDQTMAMRQQPINQGKRFKAVNTKTEGSDSGDASHSATAASHETSSNQQHQQFLGDASGAIPHFGSIDTVTIPLPEGVNKDHIRIMEQLYREHCEAVLDVVVNLQFSLIENLWRTFWRNPEESSHNDIAIEKRLPKDKLQGVCKYEPVLRYIRQSDYAFYQSLVEVLIPDVLRPIPSSLTQAIRNFAKSLETWLKNAMEGIPDEMTQQQITAVSAFAQTLRRYTSLNHLAQAARAVLQNTSQINQMLTDLNRVDFNNVQEQASWVCQCDDAVVTRLEQDFKKTLQQQNSLEQWAIWLEGVVNQVLKPHEGSPSFAKAARQFLLKWSFYSSMVIRDLTLRSAASFGSFHLIRLLYDEYMFYLVEHKVAAATGDTPIAVMGELTDFGSSGTMSTLENGRSASAPVAPKVTTVNSISSIPATSLLNSGATAVTVPASLAHAVNQAGAHAVTVVASGASSTAGTKTIVVVPVSATNAAEFHHPTKKIKIG